LIFGAWFKIKSDKLEKDVKIALKKYGFALATENKIRKYNKEIQKLPKYFQVKKFSRRTPDFVCYRDDPLTDPLIFPTLKEDDTILIPPLFIVEVYSGKNIQKKARDISKKKYPEFYPTYFLCLKNVYNEKFKKNKREEAKFLQELKKKRIGLMLFSEKDKSIQILRNPLAWVFFYGRYENAKRKIIEYALFNLMSLRLKNNVEVAIGSLTDFYIFVPLEFSEFYSNNFLGGNSLKNFVFEYALNVDNRVFKIDNFAKVIIKIIRNIRKLSPEPESRFSKSVFTSWSINYYGPQKHPLIIGFDLPSFIYALDKTNTNMGIRATYSIDFEKNCDLIKLKSKNRHHRVTFTLCFFFKFLNNEVVLVFKGSFLCQIQTISLEYCALLSKKGIIFTRKLKGIESYFSIKTVKVGGIEPLRYINVIPETNLIQSYPDPFLLMFKGKTRFGDWPIFGTDTVANEKLVRKTDKKFKIVGSVKKILTEELTFLQIAPVRDL